MIKTIMIILATTFLLVGCSANGAPSHDQVKQAITHKMKNAVAKRYKKMKRVLGRKGVKNMGMPSPSDITVSNVQIQKSKKMKNGDYKMRINFKVTTKTNNKTKSKTNSNNIIMHHKNNGKWVAEKPSNS